MKNITTLILIFFITTGACGQTKRNPKSLRQAVDYLNNDCTENLKAILKETQDDKLKELTYPWGGEYKTIFNWLSNDSDTRLTKYLEKRGIINHQETVILVAFKLFLNGDEYNEKAILKPYQLIEAKMAEEDKNRATTDTLRGIYIPKDLNDCFNQINLFWPDSTKIKVKNWTENEFSARLHMGFGMWLRNNWQLWGGSRLSAFFNEKGIYHPDDMSGIILKGYHRYLNNREIKLEEEVEFYKSYWEKARESDSINKQEVFNKYKVGDTVNFKYRNGFISEKQEDHYDNDSCIAKGFITSLNSKDLFIKVKLLDACDKKGVIYYDNKDVIIYNPKTGKSSKPKRRVIKRMKENKEFWFSYDDWETNN